jgi:hypothetical protein
MRKDDKKSSDNRICHRITYVEAKDFSVLSFLLFDMCWDTLVVCKTPLNTTVNCLNSTEKLGIGVEWLFIETCAINLTF